MGIVYSIVLSKYDGTYMYRFRPNVLYNVKMRIGQQEFFLYQKNKIAQTVFQVCKAHQ